MPRPPADPADLLVDADVCARAGSTIERQFSLEQLPRLQEPGAGEGTKIDLRPQISLFDARPAIDGKLSGTVHLSCQRCMEAVAVPIDERFQVILVEQETSDEPGGYEPVIADPARFDVRWLAEEKTLAGAPPGVPHHGRVMGGGWWRNRRCWGCRWCRCPRSVNARRQSRRMRRARAPASRSRFRICEICWRNEPWQFRRAERPLPSAACTARTITSVVRRCRSTRPRVRRTRATGFRRMVSIAARRSSRAATRPRANNFAPLAKLAATSP